MKNIHLIPTIKDSCLAIVEGRLEFDPYVKYTHGKSIEDIFIDTQHVYITSDGKINEWDWHLHFYNEKPVISKSSQKAIDAGACKTYKKIFLTTDPELIKDGVQSIDNEFLEWFIKNPDQEEIYVTQMLQTRHGHDWHDLPNQTFGRDPEGIYRTILKAVIPSKINQKYGLPSNVNLIKGKVEELRNLEDLQDAAKNAVLNNSDMMASFSMGKFGDLYLNQLIYEISRGFVLDKKSAKEVAIKYAKWQAERMYTEEEVYNIAKNAFELHRNNTLDDEELEEEFERVIKLWLNKK